MTQTNLPFVTYVINLDRYPERFETMSEALKREQIPCERIQAIDGRTRVFTKDEIDLKAYEKNHGRPPGIGVAACYMSHLSTYKALLNSSYEFALIFEDDMLIHPGLRQLVIDSIKIKDSWDVLRFAGFHSGCPVRRKMINATHSMCYNFTSRTGGGCYMINRKAAKSYLEKMLPITVHIDHEYPKSWKYNLRIFSIYPAPCVDAGLPTSIEYAAAKKLKRPWYKKFPTLFYRARIATRQIWHGISHGYCFPRK
ncbi:glycosyl transferase family 25 [Ereboglobus sp. PH5-5]|uniref:glycosyltransferase family 25 protein n=1 Tax=Ereboglobus sp. PH5-5 TaxID=2940529 RepID=UPI002404F7FD|nr:glycosyltransferase family 25 protein [Ereboglobus sp. PH5-5]MDF9832503.1 glycosyl transferase family 25 [Ereboglobus sp. PH5-5]